MTYTDDTDIQKQPGLNSGESINELMPLLYDELRQIAHRHLSARRAGATLNTTALIHEAYLRLADQSQPQWQNRVHFLGVAALAMRHILVDRARARMSAKRGGSKFRVTLDEKVLSDDDAPDGLLQITDALDKLAMIDARLSRVVEYRFFGGLTSAEIAELLGVTERTVERDWIKARMLLRELLAA